MVTKFIYFLKHVTRKGLFMNTVRQLTLGIAGFGTVGGGLLQILEQNHTELLARSGCEFKVKTVAVRDTTRLRATALPAGAVLTTDLMSIADDPAIDIAVELMGGIEPPLTFIRKALTNGKHVVTANKALLAQHGPELLRLAAEKGVFLMYEASVAGGIPIIHTLKESLAGNRLEAIEGILNGTSNFILSEMTSNHKSFAVALASAQELGYAEADPTLDIDGHDTAHKLVLLIRLAWGLDYPYKPMPVQGIRDMDSMDIELARDFGYRIKLLGQARMTPEGLDAGVFPTLVSYKYLLARVGGPFNAVRLEANALGSLFLHGQGAGALPTGSAVMGDLLAVARGAMPFNSGYVEQSPPPARILPPEESKSPYYVRFTVTDRPGVIRDITGAFADGNVSIAQVMQKEERENGVPLVFMLHEARAKDMQAALTAMAGFSFMNLPAVAYRVMG